MTLVGVPFIVLGAPSVYDRLTIYEPVWLRILESIRSHMAAIPGVLWSEFYDGSLPLTGKQLPGIFIMESGNVHVSDLACHTSVEEMTVRIGGLIRITQEQKQNNRWRDAIWRLEALIEQAVRANTQWDELARWTTIDTRQIHEPVEGIASCTVTIKVTYGTAQNDLTIPA